MKINTRLWACAERTSLSVHRSTECFEQKLETKRTLRLVRCSVGNKGLGIIVET